MDVKLIYWKLKIQNKKLIVNNFFGSKYQFIEMIINEEKEITNEWTHTHAYINNWNITENLLCLWNDY